MKEILIFCLLFSISSALMAKIVLPGIISSNMVLQQQSKVALWGKAASNAEVKVITSWNKKKYSIGSDAHGNWKLFVETPKAGGPFNITFSDGEKVIIENVLIGEVWVCSGQSNMEMPVRGYRNEPVLNYNDILLNSDNSNIRMIRYKRNLSRTPLFDSESTLWEVSDVRSVKEFSAVALQFAQNLQRKLKVPVGIILSSWGGTRIETWMPPASFESFPQIKVPQVTDTTKISQRDPSALFNSMINPFLGYGMKGVLWYQGESNRANFEIYDSLMMSMVSEWRRLWNVGDFPFYYVQIAPYKYRDLLGSSAFLREAQLKASYKIPNSGMVVSADVGTSYSIHPPDKLTISNRLAYWALANVYQIKGLAYASPVYKSLKINKDVAQITFTDAENGLTSYGKPLSAFEIAGADKVFYPANATINKIGVAVQCDSVKVPVAVRYAFKDWAPGDLFNNEGLPVTPFRTDNW